jgi:hypothetical protein
MSPGLIWKHFGLFDGGWKKCHNGQNQGLMMGLTFFYNVYSHKKKRKYSADTSLQQRRQEKNMVN